MSNTNFVLSNADKNILKMMSKGMTHLEISKTLTANNESPSSTSHIEKLIMKLKKSYKAKTSFQLGILLYKDGFFK
jgi:hypothetical protein|tara:strand:- start:104281 stop:104508 length:228 start_codon:yes stop_codon:yes gene_type:complete